MSHFPPVPLPQLLHGDSQAAAAYDRSRVRCGAIGVFPPVEDKLYPQPAMLAQLALAGEGDAPDAGRVVAAWYLTLWHELLLPLFLHPWWGIEDYVPRTYANFPINESWQLPRELAKDIMWGRYG